MENTDSERSRVCPTWKPEEAGISRAPAYSVHFLKICHGVGRRVNTWNYRTDVHWARCKKLMALITVTSCSVSTFCRRFVP